MRIASVFSMPFQVSLHRHSILSKKVQRIAMNVLIIANACLVTSLFFIASKPLIGVALSITIVGSAILIDRSYK